MKKKPTSNQKKRGTLNKKILPPIVLSFAVCGVLLFVFVLLGLRTGLETYFSDHLVEKVILHQEKIKNNRTAIYNKLDILEDIIILETIFEKTNQGHLSPISYHIQTSLPVDDCVFIGMNGEILYSTLKSYTFLHDTKITQNALTGEKGICPDSRCCFTC